MIFISILTFIVAMALPNLKQELSPTLLVRISTIILIYAGVLSFNAFYIQLIGSGIGIYSGIFQVTVTSQLLDTFLLLIGALIIVPRPNIYGIYLLKNNNNSNVIRNGPTNNVIYDGVGGDSTLIDNDAISGNGGKYSLIILFSTLGSLLLMSSNDLISMYLSIELQSFGVYILASLFRDSKLATNAGLKYFLLGGLSSCIILLGSGLIYTYTGLSNLESIYSLISVENGTVIQGLNLGIILIIIGFLFKIAAAPLHNWAPDVYNDSPSIVTIWLTIMPKIGILIFLLSFISGSIYSGALDNVTNLISNKLSIQPSIVYLGGSTQEDLLVNLLLLSSLLSLLIGTIVGLAQSKIKRLLAYSTISHIGFILLALAINTEQSTESFIFYIIQYSITNLNTFFIILALGYLININKFIFTPLDSVSKNNNDLENKDIRFISELKGQFISNPLLSLSLAICLFSMAGIPPLIGFFSKQMVLYSAIQNGYYFMSFVAIIVSVISASYYLKIIRILFTVDESTNNTIKLNNLNSENSNTETLGLENINLNSLTSLHCFIISTFTLFNLFFIFKPSILLNSTQLLSLSLFNC